MNNIKDINLIIKGVQLNDKKLKAIQYDYNNEIYTYNFIYATDVILSIIKDKMIYYANKVKEVKDSNEKEKLIKAFREKYIILINTLKEVQTVDNSNYNQKVVNSIVSKSIKVKQSGIIEEIKLQLTNNRDFISAFISNTDINITKLHEIQSELFDKYVEVLKEEYKV